MMKVTLQSLLTGALVLLASCSQVTDLATPHKDQSPKCEVHGRVMAPEIIRVEGESVYINGYPATAKKSFPHHGGVVLNGERYRRFEFGGRVRDFVCADCDQAHDAWWKEWKARRQ
ncbi:MAG: hypothetical protein ACO1TE_17085 [Prosthecobacter sp.]